ncbi:PTS sugar transporter subunit IIA [Terrisporobacter mayombei]|uniref:PTS system glucose-specific EIIA component n=1 Tax=Terrisporobacter mayombei TaxID=1541 RepID=A0ABY9Q708_9FIRM|nr:PTS glucose transporter subunit IIA [Terrisporobacter mayombei]MCC3868834.1 PTS glucose transporter subunit IIA [Terrisporobacter mayombei]WMT83034.1 PTS system glucose-specific EIIA component [Terrisporobacter mayombei]
MFSIFKKKKKQKMVTSCVSGRIVPIEKVNDGVFSAKILGEGIGIYPSEDVIISPCDGEIISVMEETKHALGIKMSNNMEVLIHVGINTVSMKGQGFENFVKKGDKVNTGDKLITFNRELIKENNLDDVIIIVVTNSDQFENLNFQTDKDEVSKDTVILNI